MAQDLDYYRGLPYEREWSMHVEGGARYFLVRLVEIPQVTGAAETKDAALMGLREAFDDYVAWRLEEGLRIPPAARGYQVDVSSPRNLDFARLPERHPLVTRQETSEPAISLTDRATVGYESDCDLAVAHC